MKADKELMEVEVRGVSKPVLCLYIHTLLTCFYRKQTRMLWTLRLVVIGSTLHLSVSIVRFVMQRLSCWVMKRRSGVP